MLTQKPRQMKHSGRWRYVETSDEDPLHLIELCPHAEGHDTPEEAKACAKGQDENSHTAD